MRVIDVRHLGRERVTGCWEVDGVLVDPGPSVSEQTVLDALGGRVPEAVLLTHVHLDHAGATGSLVRRWGEVPVYVHERGAPHLVDPARLLASAERIYPNLDERWGRPEPVPAACMRTVADGDVVRGFRVAYTPGHASHHVAYLHEASATALVGDVAGVRIAPSEYTLMPTPPPDIDVEAWMDSLATIEAWRPERLALTHFGAHEDVGRVLATAREELQRWAREARAARDGEAFLARFEADLDLHVHGDELRETYRQASPPPLEYLGLERYWRTHGGRRTPAAAGA